jgi:predicted pyridoxine 5'-phosphate oxidase superfamily flavin-nucleotide-binding protein
MNKEKDNNTIITEPLVKFFRGKNFGFLGTLNKDGSPQVTPTWIDIEENEEG